MKSANKLYQYPEHRGRIFGCLDHLSAWTICLIATSLSLFALLGSGFSQFLCEQHNTDDLCPFRNNIARNLSPFRFGIGMGKEQDPAEAGQQQKYRQ
jgi:hypothetical protein